MGTLISSNALADSARRVLFLKRRYGLDIRSGLNGMRLIRTSSSDTIHWLGRRGMTGSTQICALVAAFCRRTISNW